MSRYCHTTGSYSEGQYLRERGLSCMHALGRSKSISGKSILDLLCYVTFDF